MANVTLGNHTAAIVPRSTQAAVRDFYIGVLGGEARVLDSDVDRIEVGGTHFCFVYQDGSDEVDHYLRTTYLELVSERPEEMRERIVAAGVLQLDIADPHLYFQAPGGQVFRLVGSDEDLSVYEGSSSTAPGAASGDASD